MKGWKVYLEIDGLFLGVWACRWHMPVGIGLDHVTAGEMYGRPDSVRLAVGDRPWDVKVESVAWDPIKRQVILHAGRMITIHDDGEILPNDRALLEGASFVLVNWADTVPDIVNEGSGKKTAVPLEALPGRRPAIPPGLCATCTLRHDCNLRMDGVVECAKYQDSESEL